MPTREGGFWPRWEDNRLFTLLLAILLVYGIVLIYAKINESFAQTRRIGFSDQIAPTISVTGTGEESAVPDLMQIDFTVRHENADAEAAQDATTIQGNALLAALREAGVVEADIKTTSYDVQPNYDYDQSPAVIAGYVARMTVEVTIREDVDSGAVIAAARSAGVTNVGSLRQSVDDPTDALALARLEAIKDARTQAEQIAAAMGARLGTVVSYYESTGGIYPMYYERSMAADSAAVEIAPGSEEQTVTVNMTFSIE